MITTVRFSIKEINNKEFTAVSVATVEPAHYVDVFGTTESAVRWAKDILVSYCDHTFTEAESAVEFSLNIMLNVREMDEMFDAPLSTEQYDDEVQPLATTSWNPLVGDDTCGCQG
jgi:hypothetical protein